MTLLEMSASYRSSAAAIHGRIVELRGLERAQADPEAAFRLRRRIDELTPLWREARELAALTAHYYDRSHRNHENCTL
ncbi:MAG: hypothetical protein HFF98_10050 [Oscillibacter sp.]|jgi:hypothetical protein|uniref:hypothetical protein n=1 Tax=uncultured Oscillibacter sp. TaxID=876091 RepID=UPI00216C7816|nr:hypothetical protein [uncultured Oscillibacter sp.]MCI9579175.1 hypothetical protein [Oscillibacter sp.]